jgi:hypothetical protein
MIRRIAVILLGCTCASIARAEMPEGLVSMMGRAEVPSNAREEVEAGRPAVWVFERDTGAEQITVVGMLKLPASPQRIAEDFFQRDSLLEGDALQMAGAFSEPAVLADVAKYRVPESDLEVLADCEVHDCKFKLGAPALKEIEAIDWDAPGAREEVDALVRRRMVDLVVAYQTQGRAALGRYIDKPDSRSVLKATDVLLSQLKSPMLIDTVRSHFDDYPKGPVRGTRDRILWTVRDYGYRPVTSVVHTVLFDPEGEPARLIAAQTLYSSHYFYARLQLLALYSDTADSEQSYWMYGDLLLFDGKVGLIQRRILRSGVVDDVRTRLSAVAKEYRSR